MKTSESIDKLLPDLFKVKAAILPLKKAAENPYFNSSYVDLNGVLDGVESILAANNFILLQPVSGRVVETRLLHSSGQFVASDMELILTKNDMQALGSAISYARRYSLVSLLGLKQVDDDGNSATFDKAPASVTPFKGPKGKPFFKEKSAPTTEAKAPVGKSDTTEALASSDSTPATSTTTEATKTSKFHRPGLNSKPAAAASVGSYD